MLRVLLESCGWGDRGALVAELDGEWRNAFPEDPELLDVVIRALENPNSELAYEAFLMPERGDKPMSTTEPKREGRSPENRLIPLAKLIFDPPLELPTPTRGP